MHFTTCYFFVTTDCFIYFYFYAFIFTFFFIHLHWFISHVGRRNELPYSFCSQLFFFAFFLLFLSNFIVTTRYALPQFVSLCCPLLSVCFVLVSVTKLPYIIPSYHQDAVDIYHASMLLRPIFFFTLFLTGIHHFTHKNYGFDSP